MVIANPDFIAIGGACNLGSHRSVMWRPHNTCIKPSPQSKRH